MAIPFPEGAIATPTKAALVHITCSHRRGGKQMAVLMIGEVPGLTEEMYAGMIGQLEPVLRASKGFVSHAGGPSPDGGWRVLEVWESQADGDAFFENNVKPNLPPGVVPDRTYRPLHTVFTK